MSSRSFGLIGALLLIVTGCATTNKNQKTQFETDLESADNSYKLGLLSDAESKYTNILKEYPNYSDAWVKLGNIYVRTGQLEAAVRAFDSCLKIAPENARCWNNMAVVRVRQAIGSLEEGKKSVNPQTPEWQSLEMFYLKLVKTISFSD